MKYDCACKTRTIFAPLSSVTIHYTQIVPICSSGAACIWSYYCTTGYIMMNTHCFFKLIHNFKEFVQRRKNMDCLTNPFAFELPFSLPVMIKMQLQPQYRIFYLQWKTYKLMNSIIFSNTHLNECCRVTDEQYAERPCFFFQ